jgi:NTP pyrophosphatase (non-canonical NTP hydrolase)
MMVSEVQEQLRAFAAERDWEQVHSPKNLAMALSVEASELVEIFQWLTESQSRDVMGTQEAEHVRDELADVMIYLVRIADVLDVDLAAAVASKISKNRQKHPALASMADDGLSPWTRAAVEEAGFEGFVPFGRLTTHAVPDSPGVYLVVRPSETEPLFSPQNPAGHFKGKDPSLSLDELQARWVPHSEVIYIGKAGGGTSSGSLRTRLKQYHQFGSGKPVGHWGGRAVFQLSDWSHCLIAWRSSDEPVELESTMLRAFHERYGMLPFANRRR